MNIQLLKWKKVLKSHVFHSHTLVVAGIMIEWWLDYFIIFFAIQQPLCSSHLTVLLSLDEYLTTSDGSVKLIAKLHFCLCVCFIPTRPSASFYWFLGFMNWNFYVKKQQVFFVSLLLYQYQSSIFMSWIPAKEFFKGFNIKKMFKFPKKSLISIIFFNCTWHGC